MKFNVRQGVAGILCAIVILAASGCIHEDNAPQNVTPAPTSEMDSPVGTWQVVSILIDGEETSLENVDMTDMKMKISENGTFQVLTDGMVEAEGSWKQGGDQYTFSANDITVYVHLEGGRLFQYESQDYDSAQKVMIFEREKSLAEDEASEPDSLLDSSLSNSPEKALDNFISVLYNGEVNKFEKLAPAEYWEYLEDESDVSLSDVEEQMEELNKTLIRGLEDEYGDNIKISYKILEKDNVSSSDLESMKDYIEFNYDIPKKSVTDAVELEVELTVRGDDDEETTESTFYAVKVGGDWYICSANGAFLGI